MSLMKVIGRRWIVIIIKKINIIFFLRLKVFLLTVDYETDLKEDHEWLNFFKRKFIEYLDEN